MKINFKTMRLDIQRLKDAMGSEYTCERCLGNRCHPETCNCWCHN